MRSVRRVAAIVGIVIVALVLIAVLVVSLTWPRSALTAIAFRFFLQQRGLHIAHGNFHLAHGVLDIAGLDVKDGSGNDFFLAQHITVRFNPAGLIGRGDRRLGLESVLIQRPVLRLIRLPDGSWNASALSSGAAPAYAALPYRMTVSILEGELQVQDPQALVRFAHAFSVNNINGALTLNEGAISTGSLMAELRTAQGNTPVRARLFENDMIAFARATLQAHNVPIAPIVDAAVPSSAFTIERGLVDVSGQAYALDYQTGAPEWHVSANGSLHDGRLAVRPFIAPLRDLRGALHFHDGLLSASQLSGVAAGVPLRARGAMQLLGGVRFALAVAAEGSLEKERHLFAFSQNLPLRGPVGVRVRIDGPVSDIHVRAALGVQGGAYGPVGIHAASGSIFYSSGHLTLAAADNALGGGRLRADGDLDVSTKTPVANIIVVGWLPAAQVPFIANINAAGSVGSLVTLTGPVPRLTSRGYAQVSGSPAARGIFTAGPQELFLGPLLVRSQGGELALATRIDRASSMPLRSLELFAQRFPLHVSAGAYTIPDIPSFSVHLPALDGTIDGVVFSGGSGAPSTAIDARATHVSVSGVTLQTIALRAAGRNGLVHIEQAAVQGGAARATAQGDAVLGRDLRLRALALRGEGAADLAAVGQASPAMRLSGSAAGRFFAMLDGRTWTVAAQAHSLDAHIAGVRVISASATLAGSPTAAGSLLADINAAGGEVTAFGSVPTSANAAASSAHVAAVADNIDLSALQSFGIPLQAGSAVGIARMDGPLQRPDIHGAAVLLAGAYRNIPIGGDLDVSYRDGVLTSSGSRVVVEDNQAQLDGSVRGLAAGRSLTSAALDVRLRMNEGDLASLDRFITAKAPLSGSVDADVRVTGGPLSPTVGGQVHSDTGTIRGVVFQDLGGSIAAYDRHMRLDNAHVQLGQSKFDLSGALGGGELALHAASPRVDMSDFNDFFGGADMFAGTGAFRVALSSSNAGLGAAGGLRLNDAALHDYALGTIETHFSSENGALLATLRQNGPGGAAAVSGAVAFRSFKSGLPDFATATYNVKANVRNLAVDEITPLLGQEDLGLTGTLDAAGTLQGSLRRPTAFARVNLHDGHLRHMAINTLYANVRTDTSSVALQNVRIGLRFLTGSGQARYEFGTHRVSGAVDLQAADLGELNSVFPLPVKFSGPAHAVLGLSGTMHAPRLQASISGVHDSLSGVAFNDVNARFSYVPGEFSIGDTQLSPAAGGRVDIKGALPIQLQPLALGPKQRRVSLTFTATNLNLAALNPLTNPTVALDGIANAQFSLTGTAGKPSVAGSANVTKGAIHSRWETVPLQNASAQLQLQHDTITLSSLRGQLGSGTVTVNGAAHIVPAVGLRSNAGLQLYTTVTLHNASINVPNWLSGTFNGDLSLTKEAVRPYLAGSVALSNATVPFSAITALASGSASALAAQSAPQQNVPGVPRLLPGHTIVYGGNIYGTTNHTLTNTPIAQATPQSFSLPPVDFNVTVAAGKDVRVRGGSAIDLTADGSVVLAGSLMQPTLAGSFRAIRGQVGYFDTTFRLQRGTVTFAPTEGLLPTLDATGVTNVGGTEITVTISGRVDNLTTDFTSNPPMTRDQIVATLLHAPQVNSITTGSQQQAQTAIVQTAQNYFNAELARNLLFPFESALAQSLSLQQIAFIFDAQGNLAVEVRTNISPTVSALYRSSLAVPVTQSYGVSYNLRDYLALDLLQSQPPVGETYTTINLRYLFR